MGLRRPELFGLRGELGWHLQPGGLKGWKLPRFEARPAGAAGWALRFCAGHLRRTEGLAKDRAGRTGGGSSWTEVLAALPKWKAPRHRHAAGWAAVQLSQWLRPEGSAWLGVARMRAAPVGVVRMRSARLGIARQGVARMRVARREVALPGRAEQQSLNPLTPSAWLRRTDRRWAGWLQVRQTVAR